MKNLLLIFLCAAGSCFAAESSITTTSVTTVGNESGKVIAINDFAIDKYMGKWFEIARLPAYFEKRCVAPVTTEYVHKGDEVQITNTCATVSGDAYTRNGVAYLSENNLNGDGRLIVTSFPTWLRWTHLGRSDYWVIYADSSYTMVASPDTKYLWIYSREETPALEDIQRLISIAEQQGFDITKLIFNYPSYYAK
jgi:apolipoprotein D and lipocalin family protein